MSARLDRAPHRTRRRGIGVLAGAFVVAACLAGCGGSSSSGPPSGAKRPAASRPPAATTRARPAPAPAPPAPRPAVLVPQVVGNLPAPVQFPATTAVGPSALLIGGLDQADASVASIVLATGGRAHQVGELALARHDAAAVTIAGRAYLFGGGEPSFNEILQVGTDGGSRQVGQLPMAASDVAAATIGSTAYVVGGYTGAAPLRTIVAWRGHGTGQVVAMLPHPVRYAAVAAADGRLIVAGGTNGVVATRDVYAFDPRTGHVTRIGLLPAPLTHASAAAAGGFVYVFGGRGDLEGTQTSRVLSIDPATGHVRPAGRLPVALSDTGAWTSGPGIIEVAGGRESSGTLSATIYRLRPRGGG